MSISSNKPIKTVMAGKRLDLFKIIASICFALPALMSLIRTGWTSETGSLAPIVLILGGWTVWHSMGQQKHTSTPQQGRLIFWAPLMVVIISLYSFAQAIEMVPLSALAAWLGLIICLYAWYGFNMIRKCTLPISLTALAIPLPYTLSANATHWLQHQTASLALHLSDLLGLDVAGNGNDILVKGYLLKIADACAGASSMLSLIAIGILYAYWFRSKGMIRTFSTIIVAVPIAFCANILRVVGLIAIISLSGTSILDTILHPLAGLLSFTLALFMLIMWSSIVGLASKTAVLT